MNEKPMNILGWTPYIDRAILDDRGRTLIGVSSEYRTELEVRMIRDRLLAAPNIERALQDLLAALAVNDEDGKFTELLSVQILQAEAALSFAKVRLPAEMVRPA